MTTTVIEARGLIKRYGDRAVVDGVDINVDAGECWGLLGPNGAGKTTLLRMLLGQTPPSSGRLRVLGYPVPQQSRAMRRRVGVLPQNDNLDPDFTVAENLRTYGDYFALGGPTLERRIDELLAFAALQARAGDTTAVLSGGLQRRLSMVRALINEPELVVLDEPTTGLDPQARQMIWQRLRQLRMSGITLVLTTHYMEEAQRLCDRVTIMDHGRILDSDAPAALIRRHIEPHVVEVYGSGAARWHTANGRELAQRSEHVGETVFYYADDERRLLAALQRQQELTFLHRPANLEDVFVKLTGRELRDG
jgi:lipooligosaccharide transport system ATP-binding protein